MPWYDTAKDAFIQAYLTGTSAGVGSDLAVVGVDSSYVFSAAHAETDDLGDSIVLPEMVIGGADITNGVFSGDDVIWDHPAAAGETAVAMVLYFVWPGGTQLLALISASEDGTIPFTILPAKTTISWSDSGIMKL